MAWDFLGYSHSSCRARDSRRAASTGRVTDHRINLTLYNLDKIVAGDALSDVVDALIAEDQAARLAQMEAG